MTDQPTLIPDHAFLWTVNQYFDQIRKRSVADVRKIQEEDGRWKRKSDPVFNSEQDAIVFLIRRAEENVQNARQSLKAQEAKLKRLRKKYGVQDSDSKG